VSSRHDHRKTYVSAACGLRGFVSLQPAIRQRERECCASESHRPAEGLSRRVVLAGVASTGILPIAAAVPAASAQTVDAEL
jgi:hypothetical protein